MKDCDGVHLVKGGGPRPAWYLVGGTHGGESLDEVPAQYLEHLLWVPGLTDEETAAVEEALLTAQFI